VNWIIKDQLTQGMASKFYHQILNYIVFLEDITLCYRIEKQ